MNIIQKSAYHLAQASDFNPVTTTAIVMLFYVMFNVLESVVEKLIFGERFEHWLDPFFILGFIAYSAYGVYACSVIKEHQV